MKRSIGAAIIGLACLAWFGIFDVATPAVAAQVECVRAALLLVSRGEAPLGIVYGSDVVSDPGVRILFAFPADNHPAIVYPATVTSNSTNTDAASFFAYLRSPAAKPIFETQGFVVLNQQSPRS